MLHPKRRCRATDSILRLCTIQATSPVLFCTIHAILPPPSHLWLADRHSSAFSGAKGLHSIPICSPGLHLRTLHPALFSREVIRVPNQLWPERHWAFIYTLPSCSSGLGNVMPSVRFSGPLGSAFRQASVWEVFPQASSSSYSGAL